MNMAFTAAGMTLLAINLSSAPVFTEQNEILSLSISGEMILGIMFSLFMIMWAYIYLRNPEPYFNIKNSTNEELKYLKMSGQLMLIGGIASFVLRVMNLMVLSSLFMLVTPIILIVIFWFTFKKEREI